jgi:CubicO group peptidase (beta-lactamase class C family)
VVTRAIRSLWLPLLLLAAGIAALFAPPLPAPSERTHETLDEDTLPRSFPPLATADTPRSIEELRRQIAEVLERSRAAGVGIALVGRDGPIWIGGVGLADVATKTPVDANTVFRVASITKNVVGLGVMRLVEQGRLALDRPLRDTLPDVRIDNAWNDVAPVTLGQVLEHTAGLDDMRPNEVFTADDAMSPDTALTLNPRSRIIRWQPGTRMSYSNVGYTLAGRAIEVATGRSFDDWLRAEVLRPLGMRDADFRRTATLAAHLATSYDGLGRVAAYNPIAHRPAGALLASATDMAQLVRFWIRRGEGFAPIVSPAGLARIERTGSLPYPHLDAEYGLGNYGDVAHPVFGRGHDGGLPGFVSCLRYFPELGVGYVMLLNASSRDAYVGIRRLLFAYLVRDRALTIIPTTSSPPAPSQFFQFASPRHALFGFIERTLLGWRVTSTDDDARVRLATLLGQPIDLVPANAHAYRRPTDSGSSVLFTTTPTGTPVMLSAFGGYAEAAEWRPARLRLVALIVALGLMRLAPIFAAASFIIALVRRRPMPARSLVLWPAVANFAFTAMPIVYVEAATRQVLGEVHPLTLAICATTLLFALAGTAGMLSAVRWSVRADRPPLSIRLLPTITCLAAFGVAVWLAANGIIGLRTWAW